ncbi:hypothetical protein M2271_006487 [Streptomyces sp. LBL]|uniref:hypothetical protein n=1 Tax=Streptomyces sp. LBL TaxID=2940562 RepID=UPI002476BF1A|nr:hypothetical protein [Streptomyces sp. LBL]MDH6628654.1 hypothetical protein [Streptomyces sp. LBL]
MSVFDYEPMYAGAHYDPEPAGGVVSRLDLYGTADRSGPVVTAATTVTRLRPGAYRFDLPEVPPGRYWGMVTFTPSDGAQPVKDTTVRLDLPMGMGLVTSPEAVADALGVSLPITADQRSALETSIRNAQADVVAHLNRPLVPKAVTLRAATPFYTANLDDADSWPLPDQDDLVQVLAYRPHGNGTYDVDFLVGLNGATEETIVRYVTAHAAESERQRPGGVGNSGRRVSSVSAEGQSISYETTPTEGQAGALPTLDSLNRLRRRLYQPLNSPPRPPWPYSTYRGRR